MPDAFTTHFIRNDHQTISKSQCSTYYSTVYNHVKCAKILRQNQSPFSYNPTSSVQRTNNRNDKFWARALQLLPGASRDRDGCPSGTWKASHHLRKTSGCFDPFFGKLSESIGSKPKGSKRPEMIHINKGSSMFYLYYPGYCTVSINGFFVSHDFCSPRNGPWHNPPVHVMRWCSSLDPLEPVKGWHIPSIPTPAEWQSQMDAPW